MKNIVVLSVLIALGSNAHAIPPLTHYTLCVTTALNLTYHISASKTKRRLSAQSEQLQKHLFLQSNEPPQQYENLVYQLKNIKREITRVERNTAISSLFLGCHLIYLGYHLRNRLLQSQEVPK